MNVDVMDTQTGGSGETLQSENITQETPEQYDVNVNPPPSEPPVEINSPIVQKTIVDAPEVVVPQPEPIVVGNKPVTEDVGYIDWFSNEQVKSVLDDEINQAVEEQNPVNPKENPLGENPLSGISIPNVTQDDILTPDKNPLRSVGNVIDVGKGVGGLNVLPIGQSAEDFNKLKQKYKGYDIESSPMGGLKFTKEIPENPFDTKVIKESKADLEPKVLSYKYQPDFDYRVVNNTWERSPKGKNEWNRLYNEGSVKALNNYFKKSIPQLKTYSYPGKEGFEYAIIDDTWNIRNKGEKSWDKIENPGRIDELNKHNKTKVPYVATKTEKGVTEALKGAGMAPSLQRQKPVSFDGNGDPIAHSNSSFGSLFTDDKGNLSVPLYSSGSYYKEELAGLENQKQIELQYAKTDDQRKQVTERFDRLISEKKQDESLEKEFTGGQVAKVIKESKPKPFREVIDVSKQLGINIDPSNIPYLSQVDPLEMIKRSGEVIDAEKKEEIFSKAEVLASKDLDAWRKVYGTHLTDSQFDEYKKLQGDVKSIVAMGEDLSQKMFSDLESYFKQAAEHFNTTQQINSELNQAAIEGKTVSEYQLDKKKQIASDLNGKFGDESFIGRSKDLFNATASIHDFVLEYMKAGKIVLNDKGVYVVSPSASPQEKEYIAKNLDQRLKAYNEQKKTDYNTLQDDIHDKYAQKKRLLMAIDHVKKDMMNFPEGSLERQNALNSIEKANSKIYSLNNEMNKMQNGNRAFFLTEPKQIVKDASSWINNGDSKRIFASIDNTLSPKQKFDMFYQTLWEETEKMRIQNSIDSDFLDATGANFRSMLDWESVGVNLSDAEKKYFANIQTLEALSPMYLNNENGITEESGGFFSSFIDVLGQTLYGEAAKAKGFTTQTQKVQQQITKLQELGFTNEDLASPIGMKDLEDRLNVSWKSGEGIAEVLAPTVGIISQIVIGNEVGAGLLAMGGRGLNAISTLATGNNAIKYGDRFAEAINSYSKAISANSKLGKHLIDATKTGIEFENAGNIFGSSEDELNFATGLAGSITSKMVVGVLSQVPAKKMLPLVSQVFQGKTDKAISLFKKSGYRLSSAAGETGEEYAQELVNIYNETLDENGFWQEVDNRFGTFDKVMKFTLTSFVMGGAFGFVKPEVTEDLYNNMDPEQKEKIDAVINEVRLSDVESKAKSEVFTEETAKEVEAQIDIDNDFKVKSDDKKDETGIRGEERIGEKLVEKKLDETTGVEEVAPGGILQKPEEVEYRTGVPSATGRVEEVVKEEVPVKEIGTDPIYDYQSIKKLRSPVKKKDAIDAFESTHGKGSYKRVSVINDKFGTLISEMEKSGVIEKKC